MTETTHARPDQRFAVLDGIRGICAIGVAIYHGSFLVGGGTPALPLGYLAVDIFFVMSGFIIPFAYDRTIRERRLARFALRRFQRLAPVWYIGILLSIADLVLGHFRGGLGPIVLETLLALVFVPLPRGDSALFALNLPGWSLSWEMAMNVAYALFFYRLPRAALAGGMVAAAILLVQVSHPVLTTVGGAYQGEHWVALARITYAFFAGVLIFRFHSAGARRRIPLLAAVLMLAPLAIFALRLDGVTRWTIDLVVVLFVSPLLILIATRVAVTGAFARFCERLGMLSYPLYAIHFPSYALARAIFGWIAGFDTTMPLAVACGVIAAVMVAAYALGLFLDPVASRIGAALTRRRPAVA